MKRVVMFSGGAGSWATAKRVAESHGTDQLTLLFADTIVEDNDTYRFVIEASANVAGVEPDPVLLETARNLPLDYDDDLVERKRALGLLRLKAGTANPMLVWVADGRTTFEVFMDDHFLGNSRLANCSKFLKQKPCREWLEHHCSPFASTVYVGLDWSEPQRQAGVAAGWAPFAVETPMCERPYLDKPMMLQALKDEGVAPPEGYAEGHGHNNCLSVGCVRGGQAPWRLMLVSRPAAYRYSERKEEEFRAAHQKDVSILRDRGLPERCAYMGWSVKDVVPRRVDGRKVYVHRELDEVLPASVPLTLREFRERIEVQPELFDEAEWGGCGCFTDDGYGDDSVAA